MATMNFSVPEEIKKKFNKAFAGKNKSRVLADLMERAVEEQEARTRREKAIESLLARRLTKRPVSMKQVQRAREAGRP